MWFTWRFNHTIEIPRDILIFLILIFGYIDVGDGCWRRRFLMWFCLMWLFNRLVMGQNPSKSTSQALKTLIWPWTKHFGAFKISTNQNRALGFWPNSCRLLFMVSGQSFSLSRVFLILGITHFLLFLREIWNGERKRLNHVLSTDNQNKKLTVPSHIMFWLISAKVWLFFISRLKKK